MAEGASKSVWVPITKTTNNDDGTVTVRGKISSETPDFDRQIVDPGLVRRLLPKYMAGWKNIRVNHDGHWPAGKAIDAEWDDAGDAVITARVVEPDAVRLVQEGVLQGFSVNIAYPKVRPDPKARRGRIYDGEEFSEISLVDRPSNPDAKFDIIKAAGYRASDGQPLTGATPGEVAQAPYGDGPVVPTGWLSADTSRSTGGNVQDPAGGNSEDFDSLGNPVLQPGHVRSDAADISVITMDTRGAVVQVGDHQFLVPYKVESDGLIHWGEPEPLPYDPRALPLPPGDAALQTDARKGSDGMGASVARIPEDAGEKGVWSTAQINELPDSAFAYISPGGQERDGKTEPRDLRHLPYRNKDGEIDPAHVRDALARLDQTDIPEEAKAEAKRRLEDAAREVGIEVGTKSAAKVTDIKEAAAKALRESAHCVECGKRVKCVGDAIKRDAAAGGDHVVYKGECGHHVHRFEPKEREKSTETAQQGEGAPKAAAEPKGAEPPTGLGPDAGGAKGNTTGARPPHTEQGERQEDDLIRRMRKALDDYASAQAADKGDKPGVERLETAALEHLRSEVAAALGVQRQEAADPKGADGHDPDGVRGQHDEGTVEKVAQALLGQLGYTPREIAKSARTRHKDHMREAVRRLSQHIEEIPEDPLSDHRSEKGIGFGTGAPKDPANAPERNDGGPAPTESGDWRERIREDISEISEFAEVLDRATEEIVHDGPAKGSRLVRNGSPDAPGAKPAGSGSMEFRNATEGGVPARDTREIPKGADSGPSSLSGADLESLLQRVAVASAEAAAKAVGAQVAQVQQQVDRIAHTVRPAQPPVPGATALEPPSVFAQPYAAKAAESHVRESIGEQWNALPAADADTLLARMIAHNRAHRV